MSSTREVMESWIVEVLSKSGGSASVVEVARGVWEAHEADLNALGDAFFTWQYDLRWAADRLRRRGVLKNSALCRRGTWELAELS
jgi:hypothetical protein